MPRFYVHERQGEVVVWGVDVVWLVTRFGGDCGGAVRDECGKCGVFPAFSDGERRGPFGAAL